MNDTVKSVACPTCGQAVEWRPENAFRPFCSKRCDTDGFEGRFIGSRRHLLQDILFETHGNFGP